MGCYLATPKTDKESNDGGGDTEDSPLRYGVTAMQGWRQSMEDAHIAHPNLDDGLYQVYGVFDGHGGAAVSSWISMKFFPVFVSQLRQRVWTEGIGIRPPRDSSTKLTAALLSESLEDTFHELDQIMQTAENIRLMEDLESVAKQKTKEDIAKRGDFIRDIVIQKTAMSNEVFMSPVATEEVAVFGEKSHDNENTKREKEEEDDNTQQLNQVLSWKDQDVVDEDKKDNILSSSDEKMETSTTSSVSTLYASTNKEDGMPQSIDMTDTEESINDESKNLEFQWVGNEEDEQMNGFWDRKGEYENDEEDEDEDEYNFMQENEENDNKDAENQNEKASLSIPEICGATAVVAVITTDSQPSIIVANAGDSRAVLSRNGVAIPLSIDHKPDLPEELARIEDAGGMVAEGRIDGNLNLSRALGDLFYKRDTEISFDKQKISPVPNIRITRICRNDEFLILACDGIWDCMSNQEVVNFVNERLKQGEKYAKVSKICEELCDACLAKDIHGGIGVGFDNMTCLIVRISSAIRNGAPENSVIDLYSKEM